MDDEACVRKVNAMRSSLVSLIDTFITMLVFARSASFVIWMNE